MEERKYFHEQAGQLYAVGSAPLIVWSAVVDQFLLRGVLFLAGIAVAFGSIIAFQRTIRRIVQWGTGIDISECSASRAGLLLPRIGVLLLMASFLIVFIYGYAGHPQITPLIDFIDATGIFPRGVRSVIAFTAVLIVALPVAALLLEAVLLVGLHRLGVPISESAVET